MRRGERYVLKLFFVTKLKNMVSQEKQIRISPSLFLGRIDGFDFLKWNAEVYRNVLT